MWLTDIDRGMFTEYESRDQYDIKRESRPPEQIAIKDPKVLIEHTMGSASI
jgi:hypothetical protein